MWIYSTLYSSNIMTRATGRQTDTYRPKLVERQNPFSLDHWYWGIFVKQYAPTLIWLSLWPRIHLWHWLFGSLNINPVFYIVNRCSEQTQVRTMDQNCEPTCPLSPCIWIEINWKLEWFYASEFVTSKLTLHCIGVVEKSSGRNQNFIFLRYSLSIC